MGQRFAGMGIKSAKAPMKSRRQGAASRSVEGGREASEAGESLRGGPTPHTPPGRALTVVDKGNPQGELENMRMGCTSRVEGGGGDTRAWVSAWCAWASDGGCPRLAPMAQRIRTISRYLEGNIRASTVTCSSKEYHALCNTLVPVFYQMPTNKSHCK